MNIFVTDESPFVSAGNLDTLRVNKMIIESSSLLANAMAHHGAKPEELPYAMSSGKPYKTTAWQNHPCCIWTKTNKSNYLWLLSHLHALVGCYFERTGKMHYTETNYPILAAGADFIPDGPLTAFVNCTPYKSTGDVIMAYKMTMAHKWTHDFKEPEWVQKPAWLTDEFIALASITPCDVGWTFKRKQR